MAKYLLRNSLNPSKVVSCSITFRQIVNKGEDGEPKWLIEIVTAEPHKDGGEIPPVYIHHTSKMNLDLEIKKATEDISKQIDWGTLVSDLRPPFISYCNTKEADEVSINSELKFTIEDILPAAGIDKSSIRLLVNGFDVTDEIKITGDPYSYDLVWGPRIRVKSKE